jgi:hypothetical protein
VREIRFAGETAVGGERVAAVCVAEIGGERWLGGGALGRVKGEGARVGRDGEAVATEKAEVEKCGGEVAGDEDGGALAEAEKGGMGREAGGDGAHGGAMRPGRASAIAKRRRPLGLDGSRGRRARNSAGKSASRARAAAVTRGYFRRRSPAFRGQAPL